MAGLDSPFAHAVLLPQSEIERLLLEHLAGLSVTVERPVEVGKVLQNGKSVYVQVQHNDGREETIEASYLVAADGGHSSIRKQLGLDFEGRKMQGAYVMDVDATFATDLPADYGNFVLGPRGFLVLGKRPDGLWRLALSLPQSDPRMGRETPDVARMQQILDGDFPTLGAKLHSTSWASAFFLSSRIVSELRRDRIFLVGDAAHIHSPVGGQGMNTGIQDAVNLAWKLALSVQGVENEALLNSYQAERYPIMKRLIQTTNSSTEAILVTNPLAIRLRDTLLHWLTRSTKFQTALVSSFTGFEVHYRHSPVMAYGKRRWFSKSGQVGDIGPDAPGLLGPDGQIRRWYEVWGGDTRHQLLIFSGASPSTEKLATLQRIAANIEARYGELVRPQLVVWQAGSLANGLADPQGRLHQRYHATKGSLSLIRPDGYISFNGSDEAALFAYLETTFGKRSVFASTVPDVVTVGV